MLRSEGSDRVDPLSWLKSINCTVFWKFFSETVGQNIYFSVFASNTLTPVAWKILLHCPKNVDNDKGRKENISK